MQVSGNYNFRKHLEFLGLSHNPFPVAPDNTDFYISQHNDIVITKLIQAVLSRKGFMLLTGEVGLGKTTLSRRIIQVLEEQDVETSLILQSFFQGENLLKEIIRDFGMPTKDTGDDLSTLMTGLNDFLLEKNKAGINCAIVIDDAQNLSIESLELIRMISNLEADREKLVQILLVGQPELLDKLNCHELRQLKSRVAIRQNPIPLKKTEIEKYIQFKLNMAGDQGKITVRPDTLKNLYKLTSGNLRKLNILMDQALHQAFLNNTHTIKPGFISKADKELDFDIPAGKNTGLFFKFTLFLLVLIIIGTGAGTAFFYYHSSNKKKKATKKSNIAIVQNPVSNTLLKNNKDNKKKIKTFVADSVASFLSAYGLESFSIQFQQALNRKKLKDIGELIFDRTGLQLIRLNAVSTHVRQKYDILSSIDPDTGKTGFYLFWKPGLKIVKFYTGYRAEEIKDLQRLLVRVHLYDYNIDGIVGQIIMKSVKEFQRLSSLPVTGFPDPETIFALADMEK
ncbi:MAG: AAA family ATPase [Deltaproteobacteria bacterium]|nr:AAA family ATPase [Deltaproteobacteria bacterium]